MRRPVLVVAMIAIVGGGFVYLSRHEARVTPPVIGMVRETEIRIAPETSGRLESLPVRAGQAVRQGDLLATLEAPELAAAAVEARAQAATARAARDRVYAGVRQEEVDSLARSVEIAQANLVLAQQQAARSRALAASNNISQQKRDEDLAGLERAKASLGLQQARYAEAKAGPTTEERASADAKVVVADADVAVLEVRLAKTRLVAPVDGVVRVLVAEPGEAIRAGQPVMTLSPEAQRWFGFTLREDQLGGITIGSDLALMTTGGTKLEARVAELRPLGQFATWRTARAVGDHDLNSFLLRADPIAGAPSLQPGMTVWIAGMEP